VVALVELAQRAADDKLDGQILSLTHRAFAVSARLETWLVVRTDDAGNLFLVADSLGEADAQALVAKLTARGHKQAYSAMSYNDAAGRAAFDRAAEIKV
jgi:hypothetical protein